MSKLERLAAAISNEKDIKVRDRLQAVYSVCIKMNEQKISKTQAMKITALEQRVSLSSIKNYMRNYREYDIRGLYEQPRTGHPMSTTRK